MYSSESTTRKVSSLLQVHARLECQVLDDARNSADVVRLDHAEPCFYIHSSEALERLVNVKIVAICLRSRGILVRSQSQYIWHGLSRAVILLFKTFVSASFSMRKVSC
jgi:hypothetical protein